MEARPGRREDNRRGATVEVGDKYICVREEEAQEEMFELPKRLQCFAEGALQTRMPNAG